MMLFCFYMALVYVPWDFFVKPIEGDQEVWFGYMLTDWDAKRAAIPHWIIYAAGAWGFTANSAFDSLESQMEHETRGIAEAARSADGREGIAAFLEKRRPEFKGE